MTPDRWIVVATGLAVIAFIVWFFWLKRSAGGAEIDPGVEVLDVLVGQANAA